MVFAVEKAKARELGSTKRCGSEGPGIMYEDKPARLKSKLWGLGSEGPDRVLELTLQTGRSHLPISWQTFCAILYGHPLGCPWAGQAQPLRNMFATWSAVAAATAFRLRLYGKCARSGRREALAPASALLRLAVAWFPYEPRAEGGSCCHRTPRSAADPRESKVCARAPETFLLVLNLFHRSSATSSRAWRHPRRFRAPALPP